MLQSAPIDPNHQLIAPKCQFSPPTRRSKVGRLYYLPMSKSSHQSLNSALQSSKSALRYSKISAPTHDLHTMSNLISHSRKTHEWAHNLLKVRLDCQSLTQTLGMHRKEIVVTHGLPLLSSSPKGLPLANHMGHQPILTPTTLGSAHITWETQFSLSN